MSLIWLKKRKVKWRFFCNGFILIENLIDDDCLCYDIANLRGFFFFYHCLLHFLNFLEFLLRNMRDSF